MENLENKDTPIKRKPLWKRVLFFIGRFVKRTVIGLLLFLIFISVSVILVTQTESFRRWATPFLQNFLNDQLQGHVEFSDIEINLLRGLTLHDVRLIASGDTVLVTREISIGYDLEQFLNKKIYVSHLTIESPRIKILRSRDSTWNVEHIAKPVTDTTPAKPFDYLIHAYDISIRNATIIMEDSLAPISRYGTFDFGHLHLWNANITLSADANIPENDYKLLLKTLSFEERDGFSLKNLSLNAVANKEGIEVKEMNFETPDTRLQMQAKADSLNIFESITSSKLSVAPIKISLQADSLSTEDLLRFLPDAGINGSYKLAIEAEGTLPVMNVKKLRIDSPLSHLNATGKLKHLDSPEKLSFQASAETSLINYDELQRVTPVLHLPKLDFLGTVQIRKAFVNAVPSDSIEITANTNTKSGSVDGKMTLFFRSPLGYHADATVENINLGAITHNPQLQSSLNAKVQIAGKGIMIDELDAVARIEAWNSTIAEKKFTRCLFAGKSRDKGLVTVDTLFLDVQEPNDKEQYTYLEPHDSTNTAPGLPGTLSLSGEFDLRNLKNPLYNFKSQFETFPLAKLIGNNQFPTSMTANISSEGHGFHPDSLEGKLNAEFNIVTFNDLTILPWKLNVFIDRNRELQTRTVRLHSTFVNMLLDGKFTFESLIKECSQQSEYLSDYIKYNIDKVSTLQTKSRFVWEMPQSENGKTFVHPLVPIDMKFRINLRDISPVSTLFPSNFSLQSRGVFVGSIRSDSQESSVTVDTLKVISSLLKTGETIVKTDPLLLKANAIIKHDGYSVLKEMNIQARCDSIITVNDAVFKNPFITYRNNGSTSAISAGVYYNYMVGVGVSGNFSYDKNESLSMLLDTLTIGYGGKVWYLASKADMTVSPVGVNIGKLELTRKDAEKISLSGQISDSLFKDFTVNVQKFSLKELNTFPFISESQKPLLASLSGKITNLNTILNGTYEKPIISCKGQFDTLSYNGVLIGNQTFWLDHKDEMITGEIDIINPKIDTLTKKLHIAIEQLPLNCSFSSVDNRMSKVNPIIITAKAKELSMAIFAPFIPGINKLQGLADAEISIEGISPNLHYGGTMKLSKSSFVIQSTNIKYFVEGNMTLKNNQVDINEMKLYNDPAADLRGGKADIKGKIVLKDFNIDSLDLSITSPKILLLSNASAATSPTLYGKFVISTGANPLHFFGTLDKPFLRGDVNIIDANLTFPPDKKIKTMNSTFKYVTAKDKEGKTIVTISRIDSAQKSKDSMTAKADSLNTVKDSLQKIGRTFVSNDKKSQGVSIADLIDYDLYIKIPGTFNLKMILSSIDQLEAEIGTRNKGDQLHYVKLPQQNIRLYGQVDVKTGSKYKFFKIFDATGSLDFTRGALDNPGLNLTAKYSNTRTISNRSSGYTVILTITGTKNFPNLSITYILDGITAAGDSAQIRGDALTLLLFGKTQAELGKGGSSTSEINNLGNQVYSGLSGVISNQISDILQGTGFISDARIDLVGGAGDINDAKLNLSGQIISNLTWRVGGTIGDIATNGEFSIEAPLSIFFSDSQLLDNIILQLTKGANTNANTNRQQIDWEVKLGGRYAW
ncbi:MAG: hypothetical protein HYZ54_02095 [Ignavibacteriae bacterium]|nr:hypothetical protein [Ignavibacteriota bacterium]